MEYLDIVPKKAHRYALLDLNTGGDNEEDQRRALCVITAKLSSKVTQLCRRGDAENPDDIDPNWHLGKDLFWQAAIQNNLNLLRGTLVEAVKEDNKPKMRPKDWKRPPPPSKRPIKGATANRRPQQARRK